MQRDRTSVRPDVRTRRSRLALEDFFQRIDDALAAFSSPIAKVTRWVAGVSAVFIDGLGGG